MKDLIEEIKIRELETHKGKKRYYPYVESSHSVLYDFCGVTLWRKRKTHIEAVFYDEGFPFLDEVSIPSEGSCRGNIDAAIKMASIAIKNSRQKIKTDAFLSYEDNEVYFNTLFGEKIKVNTSVKQKSKNDEEE